MTLSSETLRKIEFREGWRGYNQVDVDVFLEEVATGVDELQAELAQARTRAERAEQRAPIAGAAPQTDETVRRTLTLAQRAADLVVSEAKAVAERIVADANAQAARIQADAASSAEAVRQSAENDAKAAVEEHRREAMAAHETEFAALGAQRASLTQELAARRTEIGELRALSDASRDRLRAALVDHLARLDRLDALSGDLANSAVPAVAGSPAQPDAEPSGPERSNPAAPPEDH